MLRPTALRSIVRMILIAAVDALIAILCTIVIVIVRRSVQLPFLDLLPRANFPLNTERLALVAASLLFALAASGFYSRTSSERHRPTLLIALPLQLAILAALATFGQLLLPRTVYIALPILEGGLLIAWRMLLPLLAPSSVLEVAVVGSAAEVQKFCGNFDSHPAISIVSIFSVDLPVANPRFRGVLGEKEADIALQSANELIQVGPALGEHRLALLSLRGPRGFLFIPSDSDALISRNRFGRIGDIPVSEIGMRSELPGWSALKRTFDLFTALGLFVLALPLLAAIAVAIRLSSGSPILLRQPRVGRGGAVFRMWKFRTMNGTEIASGADRESHVTPIGRWLRRYRLDELPQLFNVISGDMSLVGPRPELPSINRQIEALVPFFSLRYAARPGIAGLAQTSGEYDQEAAVKLTLDLQYLCGWSFGLDLRLLARAMVIVFSGRGV